MSEAAPTQNAKPRSTYRLKSGKVFELPCATRGEKVFKDALADALWIDGKLPAARKRGIAHLAYQLGLDFHEKAQALMDALRYDALDAVDTPEEKR